MFIKIIKLHTYHFKSRLFFVKSKIIYLTSVFNYFLFLPSIIAIVKLVWIVLGEDSAKMLGYRTSEVACMDAKDHHKAFEFLEILLLLPEDSGSRRRSP